jgi:hypothetical protein
MRPWSARCSGRYVAYPDDCVGTPRCGPAPCVHEHPVEVVWLGHEVLDENDDAARLAPETGSEALWTWHVAHLQSRQRNGAELIARMAVDRP